MYILNTKNTLSEKHHWELSESWEAFLKFLETFYERKGLWKLRKREKIQQACIRMEQVHAWQTRKNNKPYHIHPYMVAHIYCMSHGNKISETGIIAAILHDNIENAKKSWIREDYYTIRETFWSEDAIICAALSKKDIDDKPERDIEYFSRFKSLKSLKRYITELIEEHEGSTEWYSKQKIRDIAFKVWLIKICDRIHNLRTIENFKSKKIRAKIDETRGYILPIARELWENHPHILRQLQEALIAAEWYFTSNKAKEAVEN